MLILTCKHILNNFLLNNNLLFNDPLHYYFFFDNLLHLSKHFFLDVHWNLNNLFHSLFSYYNLTLLIWYFILFNLTILKAFTILPKFKITLFSIWIYIRLFYFCTKFINGYAIFLLEDIIIDGKQVIYLLLSLLIYVNWNCYLHQYFLLDVDWDLFNTIGLL